MDDIVHPAIAIRWFATKQRNESINEGNSCHNNSNYKVSQNDGVLDISQAWRRCIDFANKDENKCNGSDSHRTQH